MFRKLKWQIPGEPLAARCNWCQGPVPGRGPAVEKHCSSPVYGSLLSKCHLNISKPCAGPKPDADSKTIILSGKIYFMLPIKRHVVLLSLHWGLNVNLILYGGFLPYR